MNALRRVFTAPELIALCLLTLWLPAMRLGSFAESAVSAEIEGYAVTDHDALVAPMVELALAMPGFGERLLGVAADLAKWMALAWLLLAAGVFRRLHRRQSMASWVGAGIARAPSILGVTVWHWLLRLVGVGILAGLGSWIGGGAGAVFALLAVGVWLYSVCALDMARCRLSLRDVEAEARPSWWHPAPAISSLKEAGRYPSLLAASAVLCLMQWILLLAGTWGVLALIGLDYPISLARVLALLAAILGLLRWATTVDVMSRAGIVGSSQ